MNQRVAAGLSQKQRGFTLVELVAVLVIIGVLAAIAVPKFIDLSDAAEQAAIAQVLGALRSGESMVKAAYYAKGAPGLGRNSNVTVTIDGIPVRFRNGQLRNTTNSGHVPADVPQNRNAAYTRLFFLFLNNPPTDIVLRNSADTGWAMLGNNNACAAAIPGGGLRRCWEFRSKGARVARITYYTGTGQFVQD